MDQYASAVLFRTLAWQVVKISGERVRDSAINDAPFQDDTGDTRNSMRNNDPSMFDSNDVIIAEMGPDTFYSPFLEFGWLSGGVYRSYPFMIPASYKHQDEFLIACIDVATVVANHGLATIKEPVGNSTTNSIISTARKWLYSRSKALGDITVFTGASVTSPMRSAMLTMAKELGDLNAIMNHAIGTRISTRISGAFTGRALGLTRTISVNKSYSAYPGGGNSGAVGQRVQNRFLGRLTRPAALSGGSIFG